MKEQNKAGNSLQELTRLAEKMQKRNQELTPEQADALADRFVHAVIEETGARG